MDRIVSGVAEKTATSAPSATTADDTVDAAVLLILLLLSIQSCAVGIGIV